VFSIVMPVFNKRAHLRAALESVFAQEFGGFELIVVDDGSSDGSLEAAGALLDDPRVRIVRQPNAGPGAARNAGMAQARHDWIAFLDADDLWLPGHLIELDRIRGRFPEAGLIGTAYRIGRGAIPVAAAPGEGRIETIAYFDSVGRGERPLYTSSAAIPRRVWGDLGGFGPWRVGEDSEYWARIALERLVAVSRRETAVYRQGTGGLMDGARRQVRGAVGSVEELSPAAALIAGRADMPRGGEAFLDRYIDWEADHAALAGDIDRLRSLRRLYHHKPRLRRRLLLAAAWLPYSLARLAVPLLR
jgi:glycosyltransferase involved in cell wall biosynthesis